MENRENRHERGAGKYLVALLFILSGVLLLARNMGWMDVETFNVIVSWQMLLIVLGIYQLLKRSYWGGVILIILGGCFLLPKLNLAWLPLSTSAQSWPVVLITIGLAFLFRPRKQKYCQHRMWENMGSSTNQYNSSDGFFHSENAFSGARQVVLDEVFKGGTIYNSFGGTVLDLRRTTIVAGETFLDLNCTFGGIEIYVPSDWKVDLRCKAFLGGCEDKRFLNGPINQTRMLVIRGNISFGGLEIKS